MSVMFLLQIHIHHDLSSLYKEIPKTMLPKDYGGECLWLTDLNSKYTYSTYVKPHLLHKQNMPVEVENLVFHSYPHAYVIM